MSATTTITVASIPTIGLSDWKRRAILKGCFKYCVNLHEVDKVHFFKTLKEVIGFINKLPCYRRHNYQVWKMMTAIDVDQLNDGDCYWLQDLSYVSGGVVAYGDQWKGFYRTFIGRANSYLYRLLANR